MKTLFKYFLPAALTVTLFYLAAAAFTEPTNVPPAGNVPAPINVGLAPQSKLGDLGVRNLNVQEGITLGGERRTAWPEGAAGCNWEGTRCHCVDDSASVGSVRLTVGATCSKGQLTDFQIISLDISSASKDCWNTPPAGCSAGLYIR